MADNKLIRFGVSIGTSLLEKFDVLIEGKGYTSRSEAIRDLIRDKLIESDWRDDDGTENAIGTVTIVYDHHTREIGDTLNHIAHSFHDIVISTTHVHLTHSSCLEVMVVKGTSDDIRNFADKVISIRGVKHGKLVITGLVESSSES
jgi:CopG family nickel-responsive transcriptional regulator